MGRVVLVVAAHPDDEVLGAGATIAKHADAGDVVHVAILAQGLFSRTEELREGTSLNDLRDAAQRAGDILRVASLEFFDYDDNRMDTVARLDVAKRVEDLIERRSPDIVYTHFAGDLNVDHTRVSEAVTIACRPMPGARVQSLRFFEVQSSTEWRPAHAGVQTFAPNLFVNVAATLPRKIQALRAYRSEMRPWPHARSIEAVEHLARWRGACAGYEAAEAFLVARELEP